MNKSACVWGVWVWFLFLSCCSFGQYSDMEYVSSMLWSKAFDVKIDGDLAYCAFLNGLVVLDVSDKRR
ncbi:MAG: hypothetical protein PVF22_00870, partial [Candidatus Aminicenantes bacterium]